MPAVNKEDPPAWALDLLKRADIAERKAAAAEREAAKLRKKADELKAQVEQNKLESLGEALTYDQIRGKIKQGRALTKKQEEFVGIFRDAQSGEVIPAKEDHEEDPERTELRFLALRGGSGVRKDG